MSLFVCGESLIDFVPSDYSKKEITYIPKPGGSPYNVALAASRAGCKTHFIGNFSSDFFGDILYNHLTTNDVDCSLSERSDFPTTLAFVDYESGEPKYAFFNQNSTNINLNPQLPKELPKEGVFHIGSISLIEDPAAQRIMHQATVAKNTLLLSLDPNVRENLIYDRDAWLEKIWKLFYQVDIVKLSKEDLNYICPETIPSDFAEKLLLNSNKLVILTSGSEGAVLYHKHHVVHCEVPKVAIKDTVGAGDTLMGSILAWLLEKDLSTPRQLKSLDFDQLWQLLSFGVTAAALNCTHFGCNPPTKEEIELTLLG